MNTKNTIRLMELIKASHCIWDKHSLYYKNKLVRRESWIQISKEIGVSG